MDDESTLWGAVIRTEHFTRMLRRISSFLFCNSCILLTPEFFSRNASMQYQRGPRHLGGPNLA